MILTDYYKFKKLQGGKSKHRIDCTTSTGGYTPFEQMKNKQGALFCYIGDNTHTKAGRERKADLALSKTKHISSVYVPDIGLSFAYGDIQGTSDAMLIIFQNVEFVNGAVVEGSEFEIFIARGQRNNRQQLYNLLSDGELDNEILRLKERAKKEQN